MEELDFNDKTEDLNENGEEGFDEGELEISPPKEGILIEKNDRSLFEFYRWYKNGRLIIDPEWQRSYVWDQKRASKLIESFIIDIPIPVIYLAKNDQGNYEVIDGVQRLTSVFKFFDGSFSLRGLELMPDLNKFTFSKLPIDKQNKLNDCTLRTFELSPQTSKNLLFIIFERLNTGGVALNEMEIRNCIYRGKLNDLIKNLVKLTEFTESINQRDLSRRMSDRSLVLRFLAFYERGHLKAQSGLKSFLNEFSEIYRNPSQSKIEEFEKQFKKAMKATFTVFGPNAFRLRRQDAKGGGEWSSKINASVFQVIAVSFTQYDLIQITQRADQIFEEYLDMITVDNQWVDGITKTTGEASRIRYTFNAWNDRLQRVMQDTIPLDKTRIFSQTLKRELFQQSNICKICKQEIKTLLDASLDHEEHYWRGGQTVPSNASLVHRLCNLKKKN